MAPAKRASFNDGGGQATKRCDRRHLARQVDLALPTLSRLVHVKPAQAQPRESTRQIEEKDRSPADQRDQCSADERACGERKAGSGGPDANGPPALFFVRVSVVEQRQRIGNENGRA